MEEKEEEEEQVVKEISNCSNHLSICKYQKLCC